jgi:hypothetical protein
MSPMRRARPAGRTLAAVGLALGLLLGPAAGSPDSRPAVAPGPRPAAAQEAQEAQDVREAPAPGPPAAADAPGGGGDGAGGGAPFSKEWAADVLAQAGVGLLRGLADGLQGQLGRVFRSDEGNFLTRTPPGASYASPAVVGLWGQVRAVANAALALVVLAGAFHLIAGRQLGAPGYEAGELLPRLAVAALLANTSLAWGGLAIEANNALCGLVLGGRPRCRVGTRRAPRRRWSPSWWRCWSTSSPPPCCASSC